MQISVKTTPTFAYNRVSRAQQKVTETKLAVKIFAPEQSLNRLK